MQVTKELIESRIKSKYFFNLGDAVSNVCSVVDSDKIRMSLVTKCVLVLENGFVIVGHSACVDPNNYDESIGQSIAYENAVDKIWGLEGYVLANAMAEQAEAADLIASLSEDDCEGCKI